MLLPSSFARVLSECGPGEEFEGYKVVANQFVEEWDWGYVYELVVHKDLTADDDEHRFWGFTYRTGGAKTGYNSFDEEEGDTVEFYEMVAHDVVHTEYSRRVSRNATA